LVKMPLYFLDFRFDGRELDGEPLWFPSLDAAEREATELAAKILRKIGPVSVSVCIRDQHKRAHKKIVVFE